LRIAAACFRIAAVDSIRPSAHSLLALPLAIVVLREKVHRAQPSTGNRQADANATGNRQADANALAALIAGAVRLYECAEDPAAPPRLVRHDPRKGSFRDGGRELHFFDGTPAKRRLAVQADELGAMLAKLTETALLARAR
jgi:hypothetical protein